MLFILITVTASMTLMNTGCTEKIEATDLMKGIDPGKVSGLEIDEDFINAAADFSFKLFRESIKEKDNSLISPLSVYIALSMTANGADGMTLDQMETLLGGEILIDELNRYLYTYSNELPSEERSKLTISNSIWFRDDEGRLVVEPSFLQKNADHYDAGIYKDAFDENTLADINAWVEENTDGLIDKILDEIREDAVMYILNAIVFDAEWEEIYNEENIMKGEFTNYEGVLQNVDFMTSEERSYLDDGNATGFIKPYLGGSYSFVAVLPNEGIGLDEYIGSMSGNHFLDMIDNAEFSLVTGTMPKFSYDYTIQMNDALKSLGMPIAFSPSEADFSRLGESSRGNIFIGEVLHKTFIAVDERGTKAGAVTKVEMRDESYVETKVVKLDRPFMYAIIDNSTNLPVFVGTVVDIDQ